MLYVVTGGSGSGKSEFAEKLTLALKEKTENIDSKLWYIATMKPIKGDVELDNKVLRHQTMRAGKGFETKECYADIESLQLGDNDVALIECMSNLLANEMYAKDGLLAVAKNVTDDVSVGTLDAEKNSYNMQLVEKVVEEKIINPVADMSQRVEHMVVVTNEICCDGKLYEYDDETRLYMELLGYINKELVDKAYGFVEVFCGIPLWHKGGRIDV